ncbi:MAG: O-antigen ligase family protein [Fidelibacterota bacterium]|nr:MAG: O-antigen ligase family protein [Candidatus Neomarinimicrobiota bacterium]
MTIPFIKRSLGLFWGLQLAGIMSVAINPIMPLLLAVVLSGVVFLLFFQQPLLIILANEGFVKRTLQAWFPIFESVDPIIVLVILIVFTLVLRLRAPAVRRHLASQQTVVLAYLIWVVWMLVASTYAPNVEWALDKSLRFALYNSILFLGPMILIHTRRESRIMLTFYLLYGFCVALLVYSQLWFLFGVDPAIGSTTRFTVLSANPIGVARVLAICAAIASIMIISGKASKPWLWSIALVFFAAALVLTGSRGPALSFLVATVILGMFIGKAARRRTLLIIASILGIAGLILLIVPEGVSYRYRLLLTTPLTVTKQGIRPFSSILHRLQMWGMALALWTQDIRHFIVGDGTAGFAKLFPWRDYSYPHNLPFEILAEYGVLGASIFSLHFIEGAKRVLKHVRNRFKFEELMWLTGLVTFFISTLMSGDLDHNRFFWFFIGGLVSTCSIKD